MDSRRYLNHRGDMEKNGEKTVNSPGRSHGKSKPGPDRTDGER
jgi:hypothetical protein